MIYFVNPSSKRKLPKIRPHGTKATLSKLKKKPSKLKKKTFKISIKKKASKASAGKAAAKRSITKVAKLATKKKESLDMAKKKKRTAKRNPSRRRKAKRNPARKRTHARRRKAKRNPARKRRISARKRIVKYRRNPAKKSRARKFPGRFSRKPSSKKVARRISQAGYNRKKGRTAKIRHDGASTLARWGKGKINPSMAGAIALLKGAAPIAIGMYAGRIAGNKISDVPALGSVMSKFGKMRRPLVAAGLLAATWFAAKKIKPLAKYRDGLLAGLALNLIDSLIRDVAPTSVSSMLADDSVVSHALADYVDMGEYTEMSGFDSEMGDYYGLNGSFEEMGNYGDPPLLAGSFEEMGDTPVGGGQYGGVSRYAMSKSVGRSRSVSAIPGRSYAREIEPIDASFDDISDF